MVQQAGRGEILIYQTEDGKAVLDVKLENETVWLTQSQLCDLFERDKSVISRHIRNIFEEGELHRESTVAKKATVVHRGFRDNALVALTLLIAESKTEEMDMMVKVVVNLINRNN